MTAILLSVAFSIIALTCFIRSIERALVTFKLRQCYGVESPLWRTMTETGGYFATGLIFSGLVPLVWRLT